VHTLTRQLHRLEQTIADRRIPPRWKRQPTLSRYGTVGELLDAIRTFNHPDSNGIITELVDQPTDAYGVDPRTIVIMGLGRRLRMNYRRLNSTDFDDAMTDLAAVVCEPGAVAALADKPSIADTLVRRAGRRAERHRSTRGRRQDRTQTLSSDLIDDRYTTNNHGELDDLVALRSALRQLRSEVTAAVDHGLASGTQWDNLCDAVLRPALGLPSTSPTRRNGSRARQALGRYIDHALDVA
jgi:hypothetical protein